MAEHGKRLDCPVCDGVQMDKLRPSDELELTLDYCDKCGGIWFESGEVRQLRFCPPEVLSSLISMKKQLYTVECQCGHFMTRNAGECPSCGHENVIDCPSCSSTLERVRSDQFTVDVCRDCRGVWFDNIDLSAVWNLQFDRPADPIERGQAPESKDEITEDTVIAVIRKAKDDGYYQEAGDGSSVGGAIADIIGDILSSK